MHYIYSSYNVSFSVYMQHMVNLLINIAAYEIFQAIESLPNLMAHEMHI